ncbi:MAG: DUF507 family protein [Myxococcota bacterium]
MRIFRGQVPQIAAQLVSELTADGAVEVHSEEEVRMDLEAVLKEFSRRDRQISEEARDRLEREGLSRTMLGRVMARVAKERGFPPRDERLPYLVEQVMTMLFHSNNVDDIFAEDHILRKAITKVLRANSGMESELDAEVRNKIKNLTEGTASFDIEYNKVMEQIKSKRRMD